MSRTPIKRGKPPRRISAKRRRDLLDRVKVREIVIARDRGCRAAGLAPGRCGQIAGRAMLEVHEVLSRGRGGNWLDSDQCLSLCPVHHDWVTEHGLAAECLGLLLPSWAGPKEWQTAAQLRLEWANGRPHFAPWFDDSARRAAALQLPGLRSAATNDHAGDDTR